MQTQVALVTQVAYATSDSAVEQWAYDNKWVRVGEHPVIIVTGGKRHTHSCVCPIRYTDGRPHPNWRIWWELFFGVVN